MTAAPAASNRIRVLVVEDSVTVRQHLLALLRSDPQFEVVGVAGDGERANELCSGLRPDVVTLDMALPIANGLEITQHIMSECPTPILIVSSSTNRGEALRMFDALMAGAVDVLEKPTPDEVEGLWRKRFLSAVRVVSRVRVVTRPARRSEGGPKPRNATTPERSIPPRTCLAPALIAIGASTGGPAAVARVLTELRPDFPVPILVVIHIAPMFAPTLAAWLGTQTSIPVSNVQDGQSVPACGVPQILVAPAVDRHLIVRDGRLVTTGEAERNYSRPSVDVLFESIASQVGPRAVGCLLTGRGQDGANGLLAIRLAGGVTLAQDEADCAIFGMPREAIRLGAASHVQSLPGIALMLSAMASSGSIERRGASW